VENEQPKLMWYKGKVLKLGDGDIQKWIELGKLLVNSGRLSAMPDMNMADFNPNIVVQGPEDVWIITHKDNMPESCNTLTPVTTPEPIKGLSFEDLN